MTRDLPTLRIAFTALCGLAAVLLCVLWVRSYWRADFVGANVWSHYVKVESFCGQLVFKYLAGTDLESDFNSYPAEEMVSKEFMIERGLPAFEVSAGLVLIPYWLLL